MNYFYKNNLTIAILHLLLFYPLLSQDEVPFSQQSTNFHQTNQLTFLSLEDYLEAIAGDDPDNSLDDLLEIIDYFMNNPLNLLTATPSQIAEIPGLSYFDAYNIADMIKRDKFITFTKICEFLYLNEYQC